MFLNYLIYLIFLFTILLLPSLVSIFITFTIPKYFLSTYIKVFVAAAIWFFSQIIQIPDVREVFVIQSLIDDASGYIYVINLTISIIAIAIRRSSLDRDEDIAQKQKYSIVIKRINNFIFIIYGLLAVNLLYLLCGNIFAGYQPAYRVYLFAIIVLATVFVLLIINSNKISVEFDLPKQYLQFFTYSFCAMISALLIFSFIYPTLVITETNKIVNASQDRSHPYCIQMLDPHSREQYQNITTLLDLSPLTMQSKANLGSSFGWGKPYFHSLLIVKNSSSIDFYNWSYKQRTWSALESDFAEKSSIAQPKIICTTQQNYLQQFPWIFPENK